MDNRLLVLKHQNLEIEILEKFLTVKLYSTIRIRTVLSDKYKILDISFTENPSSIKFSIKILGITNLLVLMPFVECINRKLNTQF